MRKPLRASRINVKALRRAAYPRYIGYVTNTNISHIRSHQGAIELQIHASNHPTRPQDIVSLEEVVTCSLGNEVEILFN
jgi:hypothetical protein